MKRNHVPVRNWPVLITGLLLVCAGGTVVTDYNVALGIATFIIGVACVIFS